MPKPNPFENPELFLSEPTGLPSNPGPSTAGPSTAAPATDPRVDQLSLDVAKLSQNLAVVVKHLKDQAKPKPEAVPEIRPEPKRSKATSSPWTIRLPSPGVPSAGDAWLWVQRLVFVCLVGLVIVLLMRQNPAADDNANELMAAYGRSVEAIQLGTSALAIDMRALATKVRENSTTPMPKADLLKAIQDSVRRATLVSGEGPMKALDQIDPWNSDVVADRLDSSADAFEDIAKTVERLKKP
jgi:hypothetical protein